MTDLIARPSSISMLVLGKIMRAALLAVLVGLAGNAYAREPSEAEKLALADAVAKYDTAMRAADSAATVAASIPPKVVADLAAQVGIGTDAFVAAAIAQTDEIMTKVSIVSHDSDIANIVYKETPDGTPYALVPVVAVIQIVGSGAVRSRSNTFAMLDEGAWYLIAADDAVTMAAVKELYPEYAAAEFPASSVFEAVQ